MAFVTYAADAGVATLTLNRPEALNAMNNELMAELGAGLARVDADDSIRVVVLTGAGRGFCAGADLAAAAETSGASNEGGADTFNNTLRALVNCPVPTVARINGAAAGGGFGLALACDIAIAAESAFFVATFVPKLGIVPDLGTTWSLPQRVGRARALGATLLGERITATAAVEWGLIWQTVPDTELDAAVTKVTNVLRHTSPSAVTRTRELIDAAIHNDFSTQLDREMDHQGVLIPRNMQAGAQAFVEKREPEFGPERG